MKERGYWGNLSSLRGGVAGDRVGESGEGRCCWGIRNSRGVPAVGENDCVRKLKAEWLQIESSKISRSH